MPSEYRRSAIPPKPPPPPHGALRQPYPSAAGRDPAWRRAARVAWAVSSYLVVQSLLLGVAALPGAVALQWVTPHLPEAMWGKVVVLAVGFFPTYLLSALTLMTATSLAVRALGWGTSSGLVMPIADFDWPLLRWARRGMCTHVVRLLVGTPTRGTPLWGLFLRMNGTRMGRRVWINSTAIVDHELLAFGDDTVVGHDVHLSGHTVEAGCVKTGTVRVGCGVTIGVGAVIGIDVDIGDHCQVGALSFVPKYSRLEAGGTYGGIPVHRLEHEVGAPKV